MTDEDIWGLKMFTQEIQTFCMACCHICDTNKLCKKHNIHLLWVQENALLHKPLELSSNQQIEGSLQF